MLKLNDPDSLAHRNPKFIRTVGNILQKTVWPYHRAEVRGMDRIPKKNGVIYIGNHNGFPYMTEAFIFTSAIFDQFRMSRYPYILMHDLPLRTQISNQFFTNYGCIRATQQNALQVLEQDEPLLIYPGGANELMRPHRDRTRLKFEGRNGYIRLAMKYNIPIVPVVGVGGHSTAFILDDLSGLAHAIGAKSKLRLGAWPLMLSVPWGLTLGPFIPPYIPWPSKIILEVLDPIEIPKTRSAGKSDHVWVAECSERIEYTIEKALARLEAERVSKHGLLQHAASSVESYRQWLGEFFKQMGKRLEEFRKRFGTDSRQEHEVMPDADQVFAELLKQAAAVPTSKQYAAPAPVLSAVKGARFNRSQIRGIIREAEKSGDIKRVCEENQIAKSTYYRWRAKYGQTRGQAAEQRT